MEAKTQKLLLTLTGVALFVSLILVLIDYKLKRDILELFIKVEKKIDQGKALFDGESGIRVDTGPVSGSPLVADPAGMETANGSAAPRAAGSAERRRGPGARGQANGRAGNGNQDVPQSDKPVGT